MIKINELLSYIPNSHGEHGVDAAIHMILKEDGPINLVFSNPPGGSWTQFDILRPSNDVLYRWDHIPRAPTSSVKRPDVVFQYNNGRFVNIVSIESKNRINQISNGIGTKLENYYRGVSGGKNSFVGIKERPAWHKYSKEERKWVFISPEETITDRYWFRDYDEENLCFWSGFAYVLNPEHYSDKHSISRRRVSGQLKRLLKEHSDLDFVIAAGWVGDFHYPVLFKEETIKFASTKLSKILDKYFLKANIEFVKS